MAAAFRRLCLCIPASPGREGLALADSIVPEKLMVLVEERISDRRVLKLIRKWLEAALMEDGTVRETLAGTPQRGVISPLLAHIYLHLLDRRRAKKCGSLGVLIRYADDFVVMFTTESKAKEALRQVQFVMNKLGLTLHPEKTRMVNLQARRVSIFSKRPLRVPFPFAPRSAIHVRLNSGRTPRRLKKSTSVATPLKWSARSSWLACMSCTHLYLAMS